MKTLALLLVLLATAINAAERKPKAVKSSKPDPYFEYWEAVDAAQHRYLARLPEQIALADELEVFRLAPKETTPDQETFSSEVGGQVTYIIERRTVEGAALRPWIAAVQGTLRNAKDNTVGCHDPIHGIRLWKRKAVDGQIESKELVFESTLCWHCWNFGVRLPDRCAIFAFPDGALHDLCIKLLPIPETAKSNASK